MYTRCFIAIVITSLFFSCNQKKEDPKLVQKRKMEENYRENLKKIDSLNPLIQEGDMITRTSNSWDSEHIKDFQLKDKTYTHAGIATMKDGRMVIYHVMAKDSMYKTDFTLYETIDSFLNPHVYTAFGLFRFELDSSQIKTTVAYMTECYRKKVKFDYLFENRTDSSMYCSEMISKAINKATGGAISFTSTPITERRHVSLIKQYYRKYKPKDSDIVGRPIIAIDDLTTNKACKNIRKFYCIK
jgi:Permuted papain-like amidase enzyme, YaeF/YiiX, C92 family